MPCTGCPSSLWCLPPGQQGRAAVWARSHAFHGLSQATHPPQAQGLPPAPFPTCQWGAATPPAHQTLGLALHGVVRRGCQPPRPPSTPSSTQQQGSAAEGGRASGAGDTSERRRAGAAVARPAPAERGDELSSGECALFGARGRGRAVLEVMSGPAACRSRPAARRDPRGACVNAGGVGVPAVPCQGSLAEPGPGVTLRWWHGQGLAGCPTGLAGSE